MKPAPAKAKSVLWDISDFEIFFWWCWVCLLQQEKIEQKQIDNDSSWYAFRCHKQLQQSWSYEQHELTGVTTVYKAEIESVKWNFHFLTNQTILVAPSKSFQRETPPEGLPPVLLLAGQCLPTWTRLNRHFDGDSQQSPSPLDLVRMPKGGTTERQRHKEMSNLEGKMSGGPPTWWQMAWEERLQSPCC